MPSIRELGYLNQTSLLRKDFKIGGVIGNAGQKDRLSFVSLSHEINDGRTAGYSKKEIIAGVLKSMASNLRLRNVLETMTDLTLVRLMRFYKHILKKAMHQTYANDLHQCPSSLRKVPISLLFVV